MKPTGAAILGNGPAGASVLGGGPSAPGGSASAFDPVQESSVIRWWRADGVTLDGGGKVSAITDRTANADTFLQGGAVNSTYNTTDARYGNKPSIEIVNVGGTSSFFSTAAVTVGPFTIFWVGLTSLANYIWQFAGSDYVWSSNNVVSHEVVRPGGNCFKNATVAGWGISTSAKTFSTVYDGTMAGYKQNLNGAAVTLTDIGVDGGTATKTQAFTVRTDGSFAECIICNSALSAGRIAQFEAYLRTRYGHY